ncbi:uncharacterized protein Fot_10448 [Forsythia ovata]|uniref:Uncharacterized protein n=1 Tax=Forsythia ovata TaxID=205694 RepID=A0ABD1WJG0_9LAMI
MERDWSDWKNEDREYEPFIRFVINDLTCTLPEQNPDHITGKLSMDIGALLHGLFVCKVCHVVFYSCFACTSQNHHGDSLESLEESSDGATKFLQALQNGQSSCGMVFARWLVSANKDEGVRRLEIEQVVGSVDKEEIRIDLKEMMLMRSSRRHVLEDIEIKDDKIEEEVGRVGICIPTKNALLLMWCRYDPMKMAALANRFS